MPAGGKIKYSDEFIAKLCGLFADGYTYNEIGERLGLSYHTVAHLLQRAKKNGICNTDRTGTSYFLTHKRCASIPFGRFRIMMRSLPHDVGRWLENQTPEGATICDTIGAIIKDAYYEDTEES